MIKGKSSSRGITIAGSDFTRPPEPKKQAVALIFGRPGEGKTTCGLLHAPGDVAFIDIDKRGRHAAQKAVKAGKSIHYVAIDFPRGLFRLSDREAKSLAAGAWNKVQKNVDIAIERSLRGDIRTIVLDTVTGLTNLITIAATGRPDAKKDDYGASKHMVEVSLARLIDDTRSGDANLIMLAHAKEVWEDNKPTGEWEHIGHKCLSANADWAGHLRIRRNKKIKKRRDVGEQVFEMQITKAGIDLSQLGQVYSQEEWGELGPFVYACYQNYPDSEESDWT
jgi:hypothetical protein